MLALSFYRAKHSVSFFQREIVILYFQRVHANFRSTSFTTKIVSRGHQDEYRMYAASSRDSATPEKSLAPREQDTIFSGKFSFLTLPPFHRLGEIRNCSLSGTRLRKLNSTVERISRCISEIVRVFACPGYLPTF